MPNRFGTNAKLITDSAKFTSFKLKTNFPIKNLFRQFLNLFLEAKQCPNGHATIIGLNSTSSGCHENIKIPPRPPIRSTTTMTSQSSSAAEKQQSCLSSNGSGNNSIATDSPNIKFALAATQQKQQQHQHHHTHQHQAVPHAAMSEMRV